MQLKKLKNQRLLKNAANSLMRQPVVVDLSHRPDEFMVNRFLPLHSKLMNVLNKRHNERKQAAMMQDNTQQTTIGKHLKIEAPANEYELPFSKAANQRIVTPVMSKRSSQKRTLEEIIQKIDQQLAREELDQTLGDNQSKDRQETMESMFLESFHGPMILVNKIADQSIQQTDSVNRHFQSNSSTLKPIF